MYINSALRNEKIKKQDNVINPIRDVYPEASRESMQNSKVIPEKNASILKQAQGVADLEELATEKALLEYGIENAYLHDLGCGILTALTNKGNSFYDLELTDDFIIVSLSVESVRSFLFGFLVNAKGNTIKGAGHLVRTPWYNLQGYLHSEEPAPTAITSIRSTALQRNICIKGRPIDFPFVITSPDGGEETLGYKVQLNRHFYPIKQDSGGITINDQFLHQVAGLTSFLKYGKMLYTEENPDALVVDAKTARRLILTMQAAYTCNKFPFVSKKIVEKQQSSERIEIALMESAVKSIYPRAVRGDGRIDYKMFITFVNTVGAYYRRAAKEFGIGAQKNIIMLAEERAARFVDGKVKLICEAIK